MQAAKAYRRHAVAWILLTVALACHVLDEAATGFLAVYNPAAARIREVLPWVPVPTFTFNEWIAGLTFAVSGLLAVSISAFRGQRWILLASYPYALLMILNGLGHLMGSVALRRVMPGAISSPLLLAAAAYLWSTAARTRHGGEPSAAV
jgi:hypothetical protein